MALSICEECASLWVHKKRGGGLANPRCFTCEPLSPEERKRRMFFAAKQHDAMETGKTPASAFDKRIYRR